MTEILDLSVPDLEQKVQTGLVEVEELLAESVDSPRGFVAELIGHLSSAGGKDRKSVV